MDRRPKYFGAGRSEAPAPTKEELDAALDRLKPERALDTGGVLVGRDADFSWFRFVIP